MRGWVGQSVAAPRFDPTSSKGAAMDGYALVIINAETDFQRHLPVRNLPVQNAATGFDHLEPVHMLHRLAGLGNGVADRIIAAIGRGTDQFDQFVDMIRTDVK